MFPFGFPNDISEADNPTPVKALSPFNFRARVGKDNELVRPNQTLGYKKALFELWGNIVAKYCDTNLTHTTDRLVALSAVAKEVKRLMQSRYFAGLWETDLILQLPWDYSRLGTWKRGTKPYVAPSWSWASVEDASPRFAEIYKTAGYQPLLEVLKVHVELAGADEMGQVKGGYLTVRGHLIEIVHKHGDIVIDGQSCNHEVHVGVSGGRDNPMLNGPQTFVCLPVYATWELRLALYSLMLERVGTGNEYRRVGLLQYYWNWDRQAPPAAIVSAVGQLVRNSHGDVVAFQQDPAKFTVARIV